MCINQAQQWLSANSLKLNTEKTQQLEFSTRYTAEGSSKVKFLGIVMDTNLNWKGHIDYIAPKLNITVYQIRKLINLTSLETSLNFYFSHFYSILTYGVILWGNSCNYIRIFRIQKRAVRALCGTGPYEHCKPLFQKLQIMTLPCIFIYNCLIFVKTDHHSFARNSEFHTYDTRNKNNLLIPHHRVTQTQQPINYLAIKLFNKLPNEIKSLPFSKFKTTIKVILVKYAFYSVREYENFKF